MNHNQYFQQGNKVLSSFMIKEGCGGICNLALLRQDNICSHQCLNANITTHIRNPLGKSDKLALQLYVPALVYFLRHFPWVAEFEGLILGPVGVGLNVLGFEISPSNCWDAWSRSIREGIWKLHSDSTPQPLTVKKPVTFLRDEFKKR